MCIGYPTSDNEREKKKKKKKKGTNILQVKGLLARATINCYVQHSVPGSILNVLGTDYHLQSSPADEPQSFKTYLANSFELRSHEEARNSLRLIHNIIVRWLQTKPTIQGITHIHTRSHN